MEESTKGVGKIIRWTEKGGYLHGPMGGDMRESIKKIKSRGWGHSIGLITGSMLGSGVMGSNMESGCSLHKMVSRGRESGRWGRESDGYKIKSECWSSLRFSM